ncbi:MAG TPA: DUF4260 domain-containing protein [Candidatus Limnocylindrales bacterium]|nr:DUF4260 domain-containing protein [Candidatus Limnocylindrales bacterium]
MTTTTPSLATLPARTTSADSASGLAGIPGAVTGTPRRWLRLEGLAAFAAGVAIFLGTGTTWILLVPLLLAVDISMAGYLAGPRAGAFTYNLAHNWGSGILVLALGVAAGWAPVIAAGGILVAHTGMDRVAGYGLKYPSAFADTHLGRLRGNGR